MVRHPCPAATATERLPEGTDRGDRYRESRRGPQTGYALEGVQRIGTMAIAHRTTATGHQQGGADRRRALGVSHLGFAQDPAAPYANAAEESVAGGEHYRRPAET